MNKTGFIKELEKRTNLSKEDCIKLNSVFEDYFLIGKKNKEFKVRDLMETLNIDEEKANELYNITSSIIAENIKDKIKHPFKSKD